MSVSQHCEASDPHRTPYGPSGTRMRSRDEVSVTDQTPNEALQEPTGARQGAPTPESGTREHAQSRSGPQEGTQRRDVPRVVAHLRDTFTTQQWTAALEAVARAVRQTQGTSRDDYTLTPAGGECPNCGDPLEPCPDGCGKTYCFGCDDLEQLHTGSEWPERYATAIHDAMELDLSLVDQEPAVQAKFMCPADPPTFPQCPGPQETTVHVIRVATEHGDRIEPPLNPDWDELTKLRWHAAVTTLDSGLNVHVAIGDYSSNGRALHGYFNLVVGNTSTGPLDYHDASVYLRGAGAGARNAGPAQPEPPAYPTGAPGTDAMTTSFEDTDTTR